MGYVWNDDDTISEAAGLPARRGAVATSLTPPYSNPAREQSFRNWYGQYNWLDPNPDAPEHQYDYRKAFEAGASPGPDRHWPSEYKLAGHPNRFVDGEDTITGAPAPAARRSAYTWNDDDTITGGDDSPSVNEKPAGSSRDERRLELQRKLRAQGQPYQLGPGGEIQAIAGGGAGGAERALDATGRGLAVGGDVAGLAMQVPAAVTQGVTGAFNPRSAEQKRAQRQLTSSFEGEAYPGQAPYLPDEAADAGASAPGQPGARTWPTRALEGALGAFSSPFPLIAQPALGAFSEGLEHPEHGFLESVLDVPIGIGKGIARGVAQAGERTASLVDGGMTPDQVRAAYGLESGGASIARSLDWPQEAGSALDIGAELAGGAALAGARGMRAGEVRNSLADRWIDEAARDDLTPLGEPLPPPPGPPLPPRAYPLQPTGPFDYQVAEPPPTFPPPLDIAPFPADLLERSPEFQAGRIDLDPGFERMPAYGQEAPGIVGMGTPEGPPSLDAIVRERARMRFEREPEAWGHSMMPTPERGRRVPGGLKFDDSFEPRAAAPPSLQVPQQAPDLGPETRLTGGFPDAPHTEPVLVGEHAGRRGQMKPIYQESLQRDAGGGEQRVIRDDVRAEIQGLPASDSPTGRPIYEVTDFRAQPGTKAGGRAEPVLSAIHELAAGKGADVISDRTANSASMLMTWEGEVRRGRATWDPEASVYRSVRPGETARSGFHPDIPEELQPRVRNLEDMQSGTALTHEQVTDMLREEVQSRNGWTRPEPTEPAPVGGAAGPAVPPAARGATGGALGDRPQPVEPDFARGGDAGLPPRVPGREGGGAPASGVEAPASVADVPWYERTAPELQPGEKLISPRTAGRRARSQGVSATPLMDEIKARGGMKQGGVLAAEWWEMSRQGGAGTKIFSKARSAVDPDVMATDLGFADESALHERLAAEQRNFPTNQRQIVEQMQQDALEAARVKAKTKGVVDLVREATESGAAMNLPRNKERGSVSRRVYTPQEQAEIRAGAMAAREELVARYQTVDAAAAGILKHSPKLGAAQARRIAEETFAAVPPPGATPGALPRPPNVPATSTGPLPERVGGHLLAKFDFHGSIDRTFADAAAERGDYLDARRNPVPWAQTEAEAIDVAKRLGVEPQELISKMPVKELPARLTLLRELTVEAGDAFDAARAAFEVDKSPENYAAFALATARFAAVSESALAAGSETGRALNILKRTTGALARGAQLQDIIKAAGGAGKLDTIAALYKALPENVRPGFLRNAVQAGTSAKLYELWINGILSNPATAMANAASNAAFSALDLATHGMVAMTPGSAVSMREFAAGAAAYRRAVRPAFEAFKLAWQTESESIGGKFETPHPVAIGGKTGRAVRAPSRVLGATDAGYKALAYTVDIERLAVREALKSGLDGRALDAFVDDVRRDSIELEPKMKMSDGTRFAEAARNHAEYLTFTQPSALASAFSQFGRRPPGGKPLSNLGRGLFNVVMPFKRTPINIAKAAVDHSPIALGREVLRRAGLIDPKTGFEATGAQRQLALARAGLGSIVMGAMAYEVAQGTISGYGPKNADQRSLLYAARWQPYSLKVRGRWLSYSRLEPFATVMGLGADWGETLRDFPEGPRDGYIGAAARMSLALGSQLATKSYLQGPGEILQAFLEHDERGLERFTSLMAGSVVPASGFLRGAANVYDPVLREERSILDALQARIPGLRQQLPPKRDRLTGEPVVRHFLGESLPGFAMLSPIQQSYIRDDPFVKAVSSLGVGVGKPDDSIKLGNGEERLLTADEWDRLAQLGGRLIHESGTQAVNSPGWERLSTEQKKTQIRGIIQRSRATARDVFLSEWGASPSGNRSINPTDLSRAYALEHTTGGR